MCVGNWQTLADKQTLYKRHTLKQPHTHTHTHTRRPRFPWCAAWASCGDATAQYRCNRATSEQTQQNFAAQTHETTGTVARTKRTPQPTHTGRACMRPLFAAACLLWGSNARAREAKSRARIRHRSKSKSRSKPCWHTIGYVHAMLTYACFAARDIVCMSGSCTCLSCHFALYASKHTCVYTYSRTHIDTFMLGIPRAVTKPNVHFLSFASTAAAPCNSCINVGPPQHETAPSLHAFTCGTNQLFACMHYQLETCRTTVNSK